ncbi:hypothetical protein ACFTUC_24800 [Streptomyces sp. NPDC056944]|uniref:hypothetical protein n=1 Tax=Streptomyces sp. NPDC056944 TaxID=3345972 RepID=UPI00362C78BB
MPKHGADGPNGAKVFAALFERAGQAGSRTARPGPGHHQDLPQSGDQPRHLRPREGQDARADGR